MRRPGIIKAVFWSGVGDLELEEKEKQDIFIFFNFSNQIAFVKHYLLYVQPVIRNLTLFVWTSYQLYCGRITPCCQEEWNGYIVFSSNNCVLCNRHHAKSFLEVWFLTIGVLVCLCVYVFVYMCCCVLVFSLYDLKSKVMLYLLFLK